MTDDDVKTWSSVFHKIGNDYMENGSDMDNFEHAKQSRHIKNYTESVDVNKAFRGDNEDFKKAHSDVIKHMDNAMKHSEMKRDVTLHRYVNDELLTHMTNSDAFVDPGYTSTAFKELRPEEVEGFGGNHVIIHVPKGTNYVQPGSLSEYNETEHEVILPRGGKYAKMGVDSNGVHHFVKVG